VVLGFARVSDGEAGAVVAQNVNARLQAGVFVNLQAHKKASRMPVHPRGIVDGTPLPPQ
jgi:hypothetical protein